jgi:hypothetical protein
MRRPLLHKNPSIWIEYKDMNRPMYQAIFMDGLSRGTPHHKILFVNYVKYFTIGAKHTVARTTPLFSRQRSPISNRLRSLML